MELNNKEKKIKQVLSDNNFDVDTDFLWKEVSQELDQTKKRKRLWLFPFLLIGGLGFAYVSSNYALTPKNTVSQLKVNPKTSNEDQTSTSNIKNPKIKTVTDENKSQENTIDKNTDTEKSLIENKENIKSVKQTTTSNIQPTTRKKQNQTPNTQVQIGSNENNTDASTLATNGGQTQEFENTINKNAASSDISRTNLNSSLSLKKANQVKKREKFTFTGIEKIIASNILANQPLIKILDEKIEMIEVKNSAPLRWYVSIGAGAIQNMTTSNTSSSEVLSGYFEKEMALPGINNSLQLGVQTKNNWKLFGGVDYAQIVTQFRNQETEAYAGSMEIDNQPSIDPSNNYIESNGNLNTETFIENDVQWHRYHHSINLELGVSKEIFAQSKFIVAPSFSLLQNIKSIHSGYYFQEQAPHFTKFEKNEENPYRTNTGLKTQLALNLGYRLKGFDVSINTAWRNPWQPLTKQTNFYQTKNSQLSVQVRVNHLLNWENK